MYQAGAQKMLDEILKDGDSKMLSGCIVLLQDSLQHNGPENMRFMNYMIGMLERARHHQRTDCGEMRSLPSVLVPSRVWGQEFIEQVVEIVIARHERAARERTYRPESRSRSPAAVRRAEPAAPPRE